MKTIKLLFFFILVTSIVSCSSDSNDSVDNPGTGETFFNYKVDGETQTMITYGGVRSEAGFVVSGAAANGKSFEITFNQYGTLGDVASFSVSDFNFPSRMNYANFKKHFFNFELVSVTDTQVRVNFSGKLYDDQYSLEGEFSTVEGSFLVNYTVVQPEIPGLGLSAKINGTDWYETSSSLSSSLNSGSDGYVINSDSDSEYALLLYVDAENLEVGNYTFDSESTINKVVVTKYNLTLGYAEELTSVSGTFNITSVLPGNIIEGTFTVNAKHPVTGETVTVTNGKFKESASF